MILAFYILSCWLLADFLTGLFHWFEDGFLHGSSIGFLGSIAADNELHHDKPTAMTLSTGWVNMRASAIVAWPLALASWRLGAPMLVWLTLFFASFGNLVHRWSHIPKRQLPFWIRAMQKTGLFISHEHHDAHHRSMKRLIPKHLAGYKFCPMTNWMNPILDKMKFWDGLEWAFISVGFKRASQVAVVLILLGFSVANAQDIPPVEPVSQQPLTGPITDTFQAVKDLRAEQGTILQKLRDLGDVKGGLAKQRERSRALENRFGILSQRIIAIQNRQQSEAKDREAMKGWFKEWQDARTERKKIQGEIEKQLSEASQAASAAKKASAENRIWRFASIASVCVTVICLCFTFFVWIN